MKKILFAIAFVIMMSVGAMAQSDGFFKNYNSDVYNDRGGSDPATPGLVFPTHNTDQDPQAPLGSGLLVLTALGAGYAVARKNRKK